MAKPRIPFTDRFWSKVLKTETCWLWQRQLNNKGYGRFTVYSRAERPTGSRGEYAHRLAWILTNGPIPARMNVLHRCDTPACVRPDHLFLGSQLDNIRDAVAKNRVCRVGRPISKRKIADSDVVDIRADTRTFRAIAAAYGISHGYVSSIKTRRVRKNL